MILLHTPALLTIYAVFCPKLYFHNHVHVLFSECIKLLGLIRSITIIFSSLDCLYVLYFALVRSKLEHSSVVGNSATSKNANKLDRIQQEFVSISVVSPSCSL
jgi:hypothetical protein